MPSPGGRRRSARPQFRGIVSKQERLSKPIRVNTARDLEWPFAFQCRLSPLPQDDRRRALRLELAALMAQRFGLEVPDAMRQHHDWSGKDCPTVLRHKPNGWEDFLKQVKAKFVALKPVPTVAIKPRRTTISAQRCRTGRRRHPGLEPLADLPNVVLPGRFGFKTYGADAVQVITENHYRLARTSEGLVSRAPIERAAFAHGVIDGRTA